MTTAPALGKPATHGDFVLGRRVELIDKMQRSLREQSSSEGGRPDGFHGTRLLDVGCGNGAQTLHLLARFRQVVGLDVVREHLQAFGRALTGPQRSLCHRILYDGRRMPFADGSFDAVLAIETLEHAADEQQLLREIRRVLCRGGTLVLSVPNKWWIFETHGARLPLLPWNRVPFFSWLPRPVHDRFARARIYTRRGIVRQLESERFDVLSSRYLTAPMDVVRSPALAGILRATVFRGPGTPVPFLSTSVFVMARSR